MTLIEDALMVKYFFVPLVMVPLQLKIVATNLNTTVDILRKSLEKASLSPAFNDSLDSLQLLTGRTGFLHVKLILAQQDYNRHPVRKSLINILRKISQYSFSTAMDGVFKYLNSQYNHLLTLNATDVTGKSLI